LLANNRLIIVEADDLDRVVAQRQSVVCGGDTHSLDLMAYSCHEGSILLLEVPLNEGGFFTS